jgi:hypothetical protein
LEEIGREAINKEAMDLDSEEDEEKSESEGGREVSPYPTGQNLEGSEVDQGATRNLRQRKTRMPLQEAEEYGMVPSDEDSLDKEEMDKAEDKLLADSGEGDREEGAGGEKSDGLRICSCSEDMSVGWYIAVNKRKTLRLVIDIKLLEKMFSFEKVCFSYGRLIAGHLGLYTKRLDRTLLEERLRYVWENRLNIGKLKTDEATY